MWMYLYINKSRRYEVYISMMPKNKKGKKK